MPESEFIVSGERAPLGQLKREHLARLAVWLNDPEVRRGLAHRGIVNEGRLDRRYSGGRRTGQPSSRSS